MTHHDYKLGYARVSTLHQDEALQHHALRAAGCDRIFVDKASGKLASRPAPEDLLGRTRIDVAGHDRGCLAVSEDA